MDRHAGVFDNIGRVYLQQKCIWTTWQVFLEHADCGAGKGVFGVSFVYFQCILY